jgi:hypothetical protein
MKRTLLGLVTVAALTGFAGTASANQELPKPRAYPVYCGYTAIYVCGYCVSFGSVTNCTYF